MQQTFERIQQGLQEAIRHAQGKTEGTRTHHIQHHQRNKSDAFEAIHQSAQALARVGTIDEATLRDFDAACLAAPLALNPQPSTPVEQH